MLVDDDKNLIKVFISDDHAIIREGLRLLLESRLDIKVIGEAENGRETVINVQGLRPDIVILDIAMPELNGIEATRLIKKRCSHTEVIILSMYASMEVIFQAFRAGALGYILKESVGAEIINAVSAVNRGVRYISKKIDEIMVENYINKRLKLDRVSPFESLSYREREVLQLVVEGKSSVEIAKSLSLSPKTVETYRSRLMHKLGIKDLPSLVKFAVQHGLTTPD